MEPSAVFRHYLSAVVLHSLASAESAGLNATDLYALNTLELSGPLTSGELAARAGLTTGATTRLIDRLEQSGYVRRVADPTDRRKVIVEASGRPARLDEALKGARQRLAELLGDYTDEQRATLFDYFDKAANAFQEATDELTSGRG
ncbi:MULTISPECIES: MarR family winged helix-turn-helix transcriptional regulator [Nonomuraea]|uniref:MarR family winged helix-turn-helix transcriptional regulator n=1 Tax=Nonomuraea mangrovi TaxID=2316207 RepID=A0ABW4SZ00_9ACTN